jgi:SAM-dependent methyltransferase
VSACRICGGAIARTLEVREMMFGTRERFGYELCGTCGCLQIAQVPADLARHYPDGYYSFAQRPPSGLKRLRRRLKRRPILGAPALMADALRRAFPRDANLHLYRELGVRPTDRILDVGTGSGEHVVALRDMGIANAVGVDPFVPHDIQDGGTVLVHRRALADMPGQFDLVTFHHALEHVVDQVATLRDARARLAPGGRVLVRVPCVSSWAFEHYGADWVNLDAPRHLCLHSHDSMHRAAAQAGLVVTRLWCDSTSMSMMGSEQYRRDVPLMDPRSFARDRRAPLFTPAERARFAAEAERLNAERRGDWICVLLEAAPA